MSVKKISDLDVVSSIDMDDEFVIVDKSAINTGHDSGSGGKTCKTALWQRWGPVLLLRIGASCGPHPGSTPADQLSCFLLAPNTRALPSVAARRFAHARAPENRAPQTLKGAASRNLSAADPGFRTLPHRAPRFARGIARIYSARVPPGPSGCFLRCAPGFRTLGRHGPTLRLCRTFALLGAARR